MMTTPCSFHARPDVTRSSSRASRFDAKPASAGATFRNSDEAATVFIDGAASAAPMPTRSLRRSSVNMIIALMVLAASA
jgi:hypothetical protein